MIDLNGKSVLITGGCGFIGSNFIEYINDNYKKVDIFNIDKWGIGHRKLTGSVLSKYNNYREIHMDICELDCNKSFFYNGILNKTKFDYVFHFAAESHVDRSINDPTSFITSNVVGTSKLLEFMKTNNPDARIICISTDEVYGQLPANEGVFLESTPLNPRSPYSASKAASDLLALAFNQTFGMDILVTRCCNNFGPNQHDEKFIPTILKSLLNDKKIPVYGKGENVREWIFVEDHNKCILEIADRGESGQVYNVSSPEAFEYSNLDLIKKILDILYNGDKKIEDAIEFVEDRKGHDFRYAIASEKMTYKSEFKKFDDALKETVEFYKKKFTNKKLD
jgi:dTDP-glucose 4,6-dehydratase